MLYREIIAVCSQIHTKHINILFGDRGRAKRKGGKKEGEGGRKKGRKVGGEREWARRKGGKKEGRGWRKEG